jgi:multiple sugar transport system permease protein
MASPRLRKKLPFFTKFRNEIAALGFLGPNIIGFLIFTLLPVIVSFAMAFSNWDLRLHNLFLDNPISFVGLDNFKRLLAPGLFWQVFGNTLYLMMGIPFAIAGSLMAALLLSKDLRYHNRRSYGMLIAGLVFFVSIVSLFILGLGASKVWLLLLSLVAVIFIGGAVGGMSLYRTLFYTPHFSAGIATYLLWKKIYNPVSGPINTGLRPVLDSVASTVNQTPLWSNLVGVLFTLLILFIFTLALRIIAKRFLESEAGAITSILAFGGTCIGTGLLLLNKATPDPIQIGSLIAVVSLIVYHGYSAYQKRTDASTTPLTEGMTSLIPAIAGLFIVQLIFYSLGTVCFQLPAMAVDGLKAPNWLADYHFAKPALMVVTLWAAIGSNNMILYLAGLSSIPQELYEAAEIDGANRMQQFRHVTWPQLAPITVFIIVMSVIYGLQGGFEMARTMTEGGPAKSTTMLGYYIFNEGFENGRLGYAAAISWMLFFFVFIITILNLRFGKIMANE